MGRRLHYVPDAIYSETPGQRNNAREAREVIKLIELHVRECPDKSLGVVTMNIPQMELIDELLIQSPEQVRAFCGDNSRFFLRNLETVQGDEMDRRRGFQCLKSLLRDLECSEQVQTFGISSERFKRRNDGVSNVVFCDSPFEEQVVEFLENEGYEIECQYGAGKFRLDIVVKERGKNLLVVECDGASYHSSLVARTRDRARQRILEKLGWRFHRVWSTNWWQFEEQEKEAI